MPRLRPHIALCALLTAGFVSACTTSADLMAGIEPEFSVEADDPELPEEVAAIPGRADEPGFSLAAYAGPTPDDPAAAALAPGRAVAARSPELDALIEQYAEHHGIPLELLRRVVKRESTFNPAARNGPYWGLMQILPATARTMGYHGAPEGLLNAETNLIYAGKYLRGAYLVADGNHDLAVRYYSRGYYYDAKRRGMLEVTGLRPARKRMPEPVAETPAEPVETAEAL